MSVASVAWAICASVSLLASSGSTAGTLTSGGTYVVQPDPAVARAVVELWFRVPAAGYDNATPGLSSVAATAVAASNQPHGISLSEFARNAGGSLSINTYPDMLSVVVSAPAGRTREIVRALTAAYFTPSISAAGFHDALRDEAVAAQEQMFEPHAALRDMLFAQLFSQGPAHYGTMPDSAEALAQLSPERVKNFAVRAFRSQNAILILAGNVQSSDVTSAAAGPPGDAMDAPHDSIAAPHPADLVKSGSVRGVGLGWLGPPITEARAAAALDLVANVLFDARNGTVYRALSKLEPAVSVNGQFITLHSAGVLAVTISGARSDVAKAATLEAVSALANPLSPEAFESSRKALLYRVASETSTARTMADNVGWYVLQGDAAGAPGDPSGQYARDVASLDPAYVAQIVRTYVTRPVIVELNAEVPR
ncbi:MAG: insulinase family protein [Candidatus Eremiobacteraeota bacterium]|nr:insulinase family protein [Candidatus Eremiobacteraeota bacterium]